MLFQAPEWQTVAQRLDVTWAAAGLASAGDDVGRIGGTVCWMSYAPS